MMNPLRKLVKELLAVCSLVAVLETPSVFAAPTNFQLNFDDSSLPSAQGFTYISTSGIAEGTAYSAGGGLLHLDTQSTAGDNQAYYNRYDVWDSSLDMELRVRARVLQGEGAFVLSFNLDDGGIRRIVLHLGYGVFHGNFWQFPIDPNLFHEYIIRAPGGGSGYTVWVDDIEVVSAAFSSSLEPSNFRFGETSSGNGDGVAEIDYIRYANASVPEPSFPGILVLAIPAMAWKRRA